MARLLDNASDQFLDPGGPWIASGATPRTYVSWFNSDEASLAQMIIHEREGTSTQDYIQLGVLGTDKLQAFYRDASGGNAVSNSVASYSVNTWHHAAAVLGGASNNEMQVFLDGVAGTLDTATGVPQNMTDGAIGRRDTTTSRYFSGLLAETAIYNIALTQSKIDQLAAGVSPLMVQPQNIVSYYPFWGKHSPEIDLVGQINATLVNGPTEGEHVRVFYPALPFITTLPTAVSGRIMSSLVDRGGLAGMGGIAGVGGGLAG